MLVQWHYRKICFMENLVWCAYSRVSERSHLTWPSCIYFSLGRVRDILCPEKKYCIFSYDRWNNIPHNLLFFLFLVADMSVGPSVRMISTNSMTHVKIIFAISSSVNYNPSILRSPDPSIQVKTIGIFHRLGIFHSWSPDHRYHR